MLIISLFVYPLLTYLFVEQLFNLFVFRTPWRFVGSAVLLVTLVISVFILARKIDGGRKIPLIVIAGAVGYPLILYIGRFLPWPILPSLALLIYSIILFPHFGDVYLYLRLNRRSMELFLDCCWD